MEQVLIDPSSSREFGLDWKPAIDRTAFGFGLGCDAGAQDPSGFLAALISEEGFKWSVAGLSSLKERRVQVSAGGPNSEVVTLECPAAWYLLRSPSEDRLRLVPFKRANRVILFGDDGTGIEVTAMILSRLLAAN